MIEAAIIGGLTSLATGIFGAGERRREAERKKRAAREADARTAVQAAKQREHERTMLEKKMRLEALRRPAVPPPPPPMPPLAIVGIVGGGILVLILVMFVIFRILRKK
jgi:hypothetical protein